MSMDDNIPRSDPYQVPIPPPPPGFSHEPTVPSYFEQLTPTTPVSPPQVAPTVKAGTPIPMPKPRKPVKAFSKRTALILWGSMLGVVCLCGLLIMIAVVTRPWTTVHEYAGSSGNTVSVNVPTYWRVAWQCNLQEGATTPQPFIIESYVNGQRSTLVSETCQANRQSGVSAQQTQGGNVVLYITADPTSSWIVDVQT